MIQPLPIRLLNSADLEEADTLLSLAFNSPVSRILDLQLYLQIQPDGWFAMQQGARLAGMVGAVNYDLFAHVGFMAIQPDLQRQGLGMVLMQHLLADLDHKRVPIVTLDASEAGEELYKKLGFTGMDETLTFQRPEQAPCNFIPMSVEMADQGDLAGAADWDATIFGANRLRLFQTFLTAFPGRVFIRRDVKGQVKGVLVAQARRIGPWVAADLQSAEDLLQAALTLHFEEEALVAVPAANQETPQLLLHYGFRLHHRKQHMVKGTSQHPGLRQNIYAQTSITAG